MKRMARAALGSLLLATSTTAFAGDGLRVAIVAVPHSEQRYDTVGDWHEVDGGLVVKVSRLSDERYELLVAVHELVEAYLCKHAGVTEAAVTAFDVAYEAKRKAGDDSEPGNSRKAPYHRQHVFATKIERMLAKELGVDWKAYDREVSSK